MISAEHYFDWAATSPADKDIIQKALECSTEHWANPSSIHAAGTDAKKHLKTQENAQPLHWEFLNRR